MTDRDPDPQPDGTSTTEVPSDASREAPHPGPDPAGDDAVGAAASADTDTDDAGAGTPAGPLEGEDELHAQLRAELAAAEQQRDEYLDDVRRARAEFENFRKRTTREAGSARELGKADVAGALLEVLDDLDRTLEASDGSSDETLTKAIALVADKLTRSLASQGLERLDATGVPFDPEVHEAVQQVPADEPTDEPQVAQVLRPGYRLGDRTLRAAMVVVAG